MDKLYNLLQEIKKRPGHYLGIKSLTRLSAFISGYEICIYESGKKNGKLFNGFDAYIHERYGINTTHNAQEIVLFFALFDEGLAFDRYFELLEEFLKLHPENLE